MQAACDASYCLLQTVGQQNVYAGHHAVSHHPPVYGANVYAPQVCTRPTLAYIANPR